MPSKEAMAAQAGALSDAARAVREQAGQSADDMLQAAAALTAAGRHAEAASLLAEMRQAFPFDERGFRAAALAAQDAGDEAALTALLAEARCHVTIKQPITKALRRQWMAFSLDGLSHLSAALTMAYVPMRSHKLGAPLREVVRRLTMICTAFPDRVDAFKHYAAASHRLGATEEAAALVGAAVARLPNTMGLRPGWAALLLALSHAEAAIAALQPIRHSTVKELTPFHLNVEALYIAALAEMGRFAEADKTATDMLAQRPAARQIWDAYIDSARAAGDLPLAIARAEAAQGAGPEYFKGRLRSLLLAHGADAGRLVAASPQDTALFAAFESFGATPELHLGCEFGLVQRRYGTETLSLLRWSTISIDKLLAVISSRFEGVGSPEQTEVFAIKGSYEIRDTRFNFSTHSFVAIESMSIERMHGQSCRRMGFLRNKLIEDLEQGNKIPVYKIDRQTSLDDVKELLSALRAYSPVKLLCVTLADRENAAGSVREIEPGLFLGYISHFYYKEGDSDVIDFAAWRQVCHTVAVKTGVALG
jgi:hypothetical protein